MCVSCVGLSRRERRKRHGSGRTGDPDLVWAETDRYRQRFVSKKWRDRKDYDHARYLKCRSVSLKAVAS